MAEKTKLCGCGCKEEVNPDREYIRGHHRRGKPVREDTKEKLSKLLKGRPLSEETKQKMAKSHAAKGGNLRGKQRELKENVCVFGCDASFYCQHHEPPLTKENVKIWEGKLVNVCIGCHNKIHYGSLVVPENLGTIWTLEQTKKSY